MRRLTLIVLLAIAFGALPAGAQVPKGVLQFNFTLTPVATAATIGVAVQTFCGNAGCTQNIALPTTALKTSDIILVQGPTPTALCPLVGAFMGVVSSTNALELEFVVLTAVACTPAAGPYYVTVFR